MAIVVKTDVATDYESIKLVLAALIAASTITTYHDTFVLKDGASRYIVILVYDGT